MNKDFKSGFVSLIGRPNVGKSTLMNTLVGEKIAIVSNKPQTTRNRVQAVLTTDEFQAVFLDTPGIHRAKSKLDGYMQKSVQTALTEIDVILYLCEPTTKLLEEDRGVLSGIQTKAPIVLVVNKTDKLAAGGDLPIIEAYRGIYGFSEIIPISAKNAENTDKLVDIIKKYLPAGVRYFEDDYLTDCPERQIIAELVREKALLLLRDEIPHGIATVAERVTEYPQSLTIEVTIYCEKRSHKGIIIGKNGATLKKIGTLAREDAQRLLGVKINLQTWVKVKEGWRDDDFLLRNMGYSS
ncbi:GTPase Era [Clostridia bacterium]|nr:GTPase Era [Clostridia bacterium]